MPDVVNRVAGGVDNGHRLASYNTSLVVSGGVDCGRRRPQSRDRRPDQHTPTSSVETNPFRQGSPRPPTPPPRRDSENDVWVSRPGNREPNNYNRPSSR